MLINTRSFSGFVAIVLIAVGLLAGCSRSTPTQNALVRYSGTTLILRNVQYPLEPAPGIVFAKGHVLVQARQGKDQCVGEMLETLGLPHSAASGRKNTRDVVVPAGFELQWATALSSHECVLSVGTADPA